MLQEPTQGEGYMWGDGVLWLTGGGEGKAAGTGGSHKGWGCPTQPASPPRTRMFSQNSSTPGPIHAGVVIP